MIVKIIITEHGVKSSNRIFIKHMHRLYIEATQTSVMK